MKKGAIGVSIYLIVLFVFNAIFFICGGLDHNSTVWLSYAFIHISMILSLLSGFIFKDKTERAYKFLPSAITDIYLVVEFIVGVLFIVIGFDAFKLALTIQLIILATTVILLLSNSLTSSVTDENQKVASQNVFFIKDNSSKIKALISENNGEILNKKLEQLYDLLHSSQAKSCDAAYEIERLISSKIDMLVLTLSNSNLDSAEQSIKEIESAVKERNRIVSL